MDSERRASRFAAPLVAVTLVVGFCLLLLGRDPGFFWNDDYQVYHLPALRDIARAWEEGQPPLLSPSSWYGGALAAEYQNGTFSVFVNLVAVLIWKLGLSLPATAAAFSIIHLAVLAAGTSLLARHRGLPVELASMAAIVAALNGWFISWGATAWIPALTSFAWVPWVWWALERALEQPRGAARFLPAGFFIYLMIAAGWPSTILMSALVSVYLVAKVGLETRRPLRLWPLVAAWAWGAALASPALLMLVEHYGSSLRSGNPWGLEWQWVVPPAAIFGLIVPSITCEWLGWGGRYAKPAVELACGTVPPLVAIAALARLRGAFVRAFRWEIIALGLLLVLVVAPSPAPLRYSFRWLPLLHLVLGLLGAHALFALRADEASRAADPGAPARRFESFDLVSAALGFVLLETAASVALTGLFAYIGFGFQALLVSLSLVAVAVLSIRFRRIAGSVTLLRRWLPCFVVLVAFWSSYSLLQTRWVKRWDFPESLHHIEPLDRDIRYLSLYSKEEAYRSDPGLSHLIRPGNTAMFSGAQLVNGYSPIHPSGLATVLEMRSHFGFSHEGQARRTLEHHAGRDGLLELLGVDGLVLSEERRDQEPSLLEKGWETVYSSEHGAVLHRVAHRSALVRSIPSVEIFPSREAIVSRILERGSAPAPWLLVRTESSPPGQTVEYAPCRLDVRSSSRLQVAVRIESPSDRGCMVVFSRPWYPGYRAELDGRDLEVVVLDLLLPAVEVPAGVEGLLVLSYSSATLRSGLVLSALALALGLGILAREARFRRRES